MHLTHLVLTNFRNYARLDLELAPGVTLLQGNNACGKTSLLEAIFYLATAHSPHAGAERELIRWAADLEVIPFGRVQAEIAKRNDTHAQIEIVLVQPHEEKKSSVTNNERKMNGRVSKQIKVNGVTKRALGLAGELNVVLFLPEDLDLVFGSPGDRRRYLDTTLAQIDPRYGRALSKYNQVVEQRNSLLREFRERSYNTNELGFWDTQLIEQGSYLIARRAETIERYNRLIVDIHPGLTEQQERLELIYQPSVPLGPLVSSAQEHLVDEIAQRYAHELSAMRPRELGAALTLVGPHRDEVRFFIERLADGQKIDAITYASRGQGRTIALSLKLAEVALMRAETGEDPVLLLDDVMSELDATRRAALAQTVIDAPQAIITATDLEDFSPDFLDRVRVLRMRNGEIQAGR